MSRQKWEYRTFIAPAAVLREMVEREYADDNTLLLMEVDGGDETDIGDRLTELGLDGWELALTELLRTEYTEHGAGEELLLVFKRPKEG